MKNIFSKLLLTAFLSLFLVQSASAWGNQTYTQVCDQAVTYTWGSDVLQKCIYGQSLSFQKDYCSIVKLYAGEAAYSQCLAEENVVHPALMPSLFFNDSVNHKDYSDCPIIDNQDSDYLCMKNGNNTALEYTELWMGVAALAPDVCSRVYGFCIASNYLADSYNPLSHIVYGTDMGECSRSFDTNVDKRIVESSGAGWTVSQVCSFTYIKKLTGQGATSRYAQSFTVNNKIFSYLMSNLTSRGSLLSLLPYGSQPTTTTEVTTTEPAVTTTFMPTSTTPSTVPAATSTTIPVSSEGVGSLAILVIILIIIAVGYFALKYLGEDKGAGHLQVRRASPRDMPRSRVSSLRMEGEEEGIIPADRSHSRLGSVWTKEEKEE